MSLRTNLATRPFYNERAVNAIIGAVALVVVIATLVNVWQLIALTTKDRALVGEAAANDTRARGLRQQVTQARSGLDGERLKSVGDAVREANAIIDGRTFSWTALLNWLETALPPDVRIVSIKPRVDTDGRFVLGFNVEAKTVDGHRHVHRAPRRDRALRRPARAAGARDRRRHHRGDGRGLLPAARRGAGGGSAMTPGALLSRIARERRRWLVPLGIAALVNVGVYALVVYPLSLKVAASERRAASSRQQLASVEREDRTTKTTVGRAAQADTDLKQFYRRRCQVPSRRARRMTYARLAELADDNGVVIERRNYDLRRDLQGTAAEADDRHGAGRRIPGHSRLHPRARDLAASSSSSRTSRSAKARSRTPRCRCPCSWRHTSRGRRMASKSRRQLGLLGALLAVLVFVLIVNRDPDAVRIDGGGAGARPAPGGSRGASPRGDGGGTPRCPEPGASGSGSRRTQPIPIPAGGPAAGAADRPRRACGPGGLPVPPVPVGPPPPPPIALKFIGLVEQAPSRLKLAVLSDGRNVFYGKEGDTIEGRYRIERIGAESIDMAYIDGRGRQTLRLSGS